MHGRRPDRDTAVRAESGTSGSYSPEEAATDVATGTTALGRLGLRATPAWTLPTVLGADRERIPEIVVTAVLSPPGRGPAVLTVQDTPDDAQLAAAYDAATGAPLWQTGLTPDGTAGRSDGDLYDDDVVVTPDLVLIDTDRELAALDPTTGVVRWCLGAATGDRTVRGLPGGVVVDESRSAGDSEVRLLDAATGDERWSAGYERSRITRPGTTEVSASRVGVAVTDAQAGGAGTRAFDLARGTPEWRRTDGRLQPFAAWWESSELATDIDIQGEVHLPSRPGEPGVVLQDAGPVDRPDLGGGLVGFDPGTGRVLWRLRGADLDLDPNHFRFSDAIDLGGRRLVGTSTGPGRAVLVEAATGRVLGSIADVGPEAAGAGSTLDIANWGTTAYRIR